MGKKKRSNKAKGDIVEQIVERLYEDSDVTVQRDVRLPARGSARMRTRQIDVLITRAVAGLLVRIAIECKNEAKPVDVKTVDAFLSALQDVGIPPQYGIMVSASGYTEGAVERAEKEGLQLQILDGLTPDRIAAKVAEALQLILHVELRVLGFNAQSRLFRDADGKFCGIVDDLIWRKWLSGGIPSILGEHEVELEIPEAWIYADDYREIQLRSVSAKVVVVVGYVISVPGRYETYELTTIAVKPAYRMQTRAYFDVPNGPQPVRTVRTEAELDALMAEPPAVKAQVGRFRIPRIRTSVSDPFDESAMVQCYWPPSERVHSTLAARARAALAGQAPDPPVLTLEYLEGTDLKAAFEPISERYPTPGGSSAVVGDQPCPLAPTSARSLPRRCPTSRPARRRCCTTPCSSTRIRSGRW